MYVLSFFNILSMFFNYSPILPWFISIPPNIKQINWLLPAQLLFRPSQADKQLWQLFLLD